MGFIARLFGFKTKDGNARPEASSNHPDEYTQVLGFNSSLSTLLERDKFIARSDYRPLIKCYEALPSFFETLKRSNTMKTYVKGNNLDEQVIKKFLKDYAELVDLTKAPSFIKKHNEEFVRRHLNDEKTYLDNILKECDPNIMLDDEQREVVLSNEDYSLVIAGAGAGKTTTVAAKVRYLVEKQNVDPKQILVISFTNKAVNELKERINSNLQIPCPISTFHSIGYAITKITEESRRKIVDGGYMYHVINNYLKAHALRNSELVDNLILFFGSYFTAPYEGKSLSEYFDFVSKAEHSTIKSNVQEYVQQVIDRKTAEIRTLNNELLRSQEEVNIANFLYMHQIDYEYEPFYQYQILDSNKPYTPDFRIRQGDKTTYIEHFGITQSGEHSLYSRTELEKYKQRVNDKILLHREHKTDLIYTFSKYNDGEHYLVHLEKELLARGYELKKRPSEDVYQKIINSEENKYINKLAYLICDFISNFKTQGYTEEQFDIFKTNIDNVRTRLFLDICRICYLEYQKCLVQDHCTDFEDMINESADLIRKKKIDKERLGFKYIIVDEYQDISRQRYNLIKELSALCEAKIVAVGDDWQSIYAFSGSILPLFTHFCEEFGYGQELKITRTYRNAQELINIAGNFVQRNSEQIRKSLISNKSIENPVIIQTYNDSNQNKGKDTEKGGIYNQLAEAVNQSIQAILDHNANEKKAGIASILLIGRYGFDARNLCHSNSFNYDEKTNNVYSAKFGKRVKLSFLTAHSSKGLSADNVIIINAKDERFGFPSQIEDDPVLRLVVSHDDSYNYAEERRLFYVALTRTKNRVFIVTPERKPSEFIRELLDETNLYPNVILNGNINHRSHNKKNKLCCPICGYPLQRRMNKNYGLELYICTNDQELCGFMTNDLRGGDFTIKKCDNCKDGYLIVKPGRNDNRPFLGCTNYKADKTGCNRMMSKESYLMWKKDGIGAEDPSVNKPSFLRVKKTSEQGTVTPPPMIDPKKPIVRKEERKSNVHTTTTQLCYVEKDGFNVICDATGNILTDMDLLHKIRRWRVETAIKNDKKAESIINNATIVELATRHPMTQEELLMISGIGDKKAFAYGADILQIIKEHNSDPTPS
jgi:DNA helicase-4